MKERGEDVCFRKSQDRTREACFLLSPLLNSLIHAATPPPFCLIQRDSISILVPSFALPINPFLPCVGGPKCPSLFRKVSENGESCSSYLYSKSRGGQTSEENEGFSKETGRLGGIGAVTPRLCTLFLRVRSSYMASGHPLALLIIYSIASWNCIRRGFWFFFSCPNCNQHGCL